jgi:hypothetical protein
LVKYLDGKTELRGGSEEDLVAAKEWISLFWHHARKRSNWGQSRNPGRESRRRHRHSAWTAAQTLEHRLGTPSSALLLCSRLRTLGNNSSSLYGWRRYGYYGVLEGTNYYPPYYTAKLRRQFVQAGDTASPRPVTTRSSPPMRSTGLLERCRQPLPVQAPGGRQGRVLGLDGQDVMQTQGLLTGRFLGERGVH